MQYIESISTDPCWNLALEQYVFDRLDRRESYFMLWQNDKTVVIGKNQNAAAEINGDYVRRNGVTVVRRLSGGGAVYHDLGNLNFTFITDADALEQINFSRFCLPIVQALRDLGVPAEINGRNDITIDGRKFSGNSQYIHEGRVMHHGTLLFASDLDAVQQALRVDDAKMVSKGIASIRSRVTNISEHLNSRVTLGDFKRSLLDGVFSRETAQPLAFTEEDRSSIHKIREGRYATWEWNYGRSPAYSTTRTGRLEGCGTVTASMSVENGFIRQIAFFGDFFGSGDIDEFAKLLLNCRYHREDVFRVLQSCDLDWYIRGCGASRLAALLVP